MILLILASVVPPAFSQYSSFDMKPDLSFGEQNDRFDVGNIIKEQQRSYHDEPEDYRRQMPSDTFDAQESEAKLRTDVFLSSNDFAYHDKMESEEGDTDFERNLQEFKGNRRFLQSLVDSLHGGKVQNGRRAVQDSEKEILFHHAVPVKLTVRGFMQLPIEYE